VMALGYALFYCGAVLRRGAWMARVRQVNIAMAIALIVLSALWLTPVLNAERIAAGSQLARFEAGTLTAETVEPYDYADWGLAGDALLATLTAKSQEPGQEALAARLAGTLSPAPRVEQTEADIRTALVAEMPLQPATATVARDKIMALADISEIGRWLDACRVTLSNGKPGCVMVVANLLPEVPGDEALFGSYYAYDATSGYASYEMVYEGQGLLQYRSVLSPVLSPDVSLDDVAILTALQGTPPVIKPVPMNMIDAGSFRMMVSPQ
jgi:hypothetical protein